MLDFLLWNKIARVIAQLAETLDVSTDKAMTMFYESDVCTMLHNEEYGLHLMSDTYIVNDIIAELKRKSLLPQTRTSSTDNCTAQCK